MKGQLQYNTIRLDYLMMLWKKEIFHYAIELKESNKKVHQEMYKKLEKIDYEIVKKLLNLYIYRCKFKHALAFMQFRRISPDATNEELKVMFNGRKKFAVGLVKGA